MVHLKYVLAFLEAAAISVSLIHLRLLDTAANYSCLNIDMKRYNNIKLLLKYTT